MIEIRQPEESDKAALVALMRISFNAKPAWARLIAPELHLDRFRCAYESAVMVAMAQTWQLRQWIGGSPLPMAGIAAVAALPERRGAGITSQLMRVLLEEARASGSFVSTLYPSRSAFYRRLGYEYAGLLTQYRTSLTELPAGGPMAEVRECTEADLAAVRACYSRFAAGQNGVVESMDEDWWRIRVLRRLNPDVNARAVVVEGPDGVDGYAAFQLETLPETPWGYRITCSHVVTTTLAATRSLLAYFHGFRGMGQFLCWFGPPGDPIGLLLGGGADTLQTFRSLRFMTRLLDVPRALEARGYPAVAGEANIAVRDELFPDNEGPFRIVAQEGRVHVTKIAAPVLSTPIPVSVLSSLFTGFVTVNDLVRIGLLDGADPSVPFLSSLFAAPPPWMTDFF